MNMVLYSCGPLSVCLSVCLCLCVWSVVIKQVPTTARWHWWTWSTTPHVGRRLSTLRRYHRWQFVDVASEEVWSEIRSTPSFPLSFLAAFCRTFHRKNSTL